MSWEEIQSQVAEADHPYDTRLLHVATARAAWLRRFGGNSRTFNNWASSSSPTEWTHERPYASSQRVSILCVPYWVNPGLRRLRLSIHYRVSRHSYDGGVGTRSLPDHVKLRARLIGNDGVGDVELEPVWQGGGADGTAPDWGWSQWTLELGAWAISATNGVWAWLSIELTSTTRANSSNNDGLILSAVDTEVLYGRVRAESDSDFYLNSSSPAAPYDSSHGDNGVTATALRDAEGGLIDIWDHLKQGLNPTKEMWVWPRTVHNRELPSGGRAWKVELSYLQWRSINVAEEYDDEIDVSPLDLLPAAPTTTSVPATLARATNAVMSRRRLVAGPHWGTVPDDGSLWANHHYTLRWSFVRGEEGSGEVYREGGILHDAVAALEFRANISPFYYTKRLSTDATYAELQDASVEGWTRWTAYVEQINDVGNWVEVGTGELEHPTAFVFGQSSGASHHLLALIKQWEIEDVPAGPEGHGYVYREGMLALDDGDLEVVSSPRNNISIIVDDLSGLDPYEPFRCRLECEIVHPSDSELPARVSDDADETILTPTGSINHERMRVIVLGATVWSSP